MISNETVGDNMWEFLEWLKVVKKRNNRTIKQYASILREFRRFEPITEKSWRRYLETITKNKPTTQRNKLTVVKMYLNWKVDNGLLATRTRFWNQAEPSKSKPLPKALELEEVQAIINATNDQYYRAVFSLLANTGMRVSELLNLQKDDVVLTAKSAKIFIRGKGNKERVVKVDKRIVEQAIKAGVLDRKVSPRAIEKAIKKAAEKAGIKKKVTPHMLRHSFAVALVEQGVPINKVQALLGHASLAITGVYLTIAADNFEVPILV